MVSHAHPIASLALVPLPPVASDYVTVDVFASTAHQPIAYY
jgi:hypothetical protein